MSRTPIHTYRFQPKPGTSLSPEVEEISMVGVRLTGADPEAITTAPAVYETLTAFTRLLEVGWLPGRSLIIAQLASYASEGGPTLEVELGLGIAGGWRCTATEAEVFGETAIDLLTGAAGAYAVEPNDPRSLLYADDYDHSALIRRRRLLVTDADTTSEVVSPLVGGFDPWRSVCQTLLRSQRPLRLRTTLLAAEAALTERLEASTVLRTTAGMVASETVDPETAHFGARLADVQRLSLERLHSPCYVTEIAVTSVDPIPELVVRTLAAGVTRELATDPQAPVRLAGGYEIERNPEGLRRAHSYGVPLRGGLQPRATADLLPIQEAALACRWPIPVGTAIPTIPARAFQPLPAPTAMSEGAVLGRDTAGRPIRLDDRTRTGHIHLLGATGTGKTTLIRQLIAHDLRQDRGFLLIDPHGDLADQALTMAQERHRDPVLISPGQKQTDSLAILRNVNGAEPDEELVDRAVGRIVEAVTSHLPANYSGPLFRTTARAALTLLAYTDAPNLLTSVGRVIREEDFGRNLLDKGKAPRWVGEQLHNSYRLGTWEQAEQAIYVASKFDDLANNAGIRRALTSDDPNQTFESLIEAGRPVIVNLAKGTLSAMNSRHLGHLILALALDSAFERPPGQRDLWSVYVDEAPSFPATNLERALAEGRKFGLGLVLAHQHLSQFTTSTRDAIRGNTATTVAFRVAPTDAYLLAEDLCVPERQLRAFPDLHGVVRTPIPGHGPASFSIRLTRDWTTARGVSESEHGAVESSYSLAHVSSHAVELQGSGSR